jgi:hypothetical protein
MIDPRTLHLTDRATSKRSVRVRVAPGEFKYWNPDEAPPPVVDTSPPRITTRPVRIARAFKPRS